MGIFSTIGKGFKKFGKGMAHVYEHEWDQVKNTAKKFKSDPLGALEDVATVGGEAVEFVLKPSPGNPLIKWQAKNIGNSMGKEFGLGKVGNVADYIPNTSRVAAAREMLDETARQNPQEPDTDSNINMGFFSKIFKGKAGGLVKSIGGAALRGVGSMLAGGGNQPAEAQQSGPSVDFSGLLNQAKSIGRKHHKKARTYFRGLKRKGRTLYNQQLNRSLDMYNQMQDYGQDKLSQLQNYAANVSTQANNMYNQAMERAEEYAERANMAFSAPEPYPYGANPATYGPPLY